MLQTLILPQQPTVVRRAVLAIGDVLAWIPDACSEVADHLYHHQLAAAGYTFAHCHSLPGGSSPPRPTSRSRAQSTPPDSS